MFFKNHTKQIFTSKNRFMWGIDPILLCKVVYKLNARLAFMLFWVLPRKNALWKRFDLLLKHAKGLSNIIVKASNLFVTLLVHLQLENPLGTLKIQGWMTSMSWQKSSAAVVGVFRISLAMTFGFLHWEDFCRFSLLRKGDHTRWIF